MADYSKKERAELRRLASEAHERELGSHLAELDKSFAKWRSGKLASSELSDEIHEFHQHAAREVWSAYQVRDEGFLVARAVAKGILSQDEVPQPLLEKLQDSLASFEGSRRD